jgi:uncharacterized membrane protein YbhN (UPF0104 family)
VNAAGAPAPLTPALPPPSATDTPRRPWRSIVGFTVGLLLLLAAVRAVVTQGAGAQNAWASIRSAPPHLIALALLLPAANWLIVSLSFWLVMRRYGPVGPAEMARLIGAAWLLNYLPLRPGMLGRVAYHRAVNQISIADSIRGLIIGMACGLAAVAAVLAVAFAVPRGASTIAWTVALASPPALLLIWFAITALQSRQAPAQPAPVQSPSDLHPLSTFHASWLPLNLLLRYADMLVWLCRYAVVFALVGRPLSIGAAAAITGVSQLAMCVPFVGNGLGLREWAVGLTAAHLPTGLTTPDALTTVGLAAELVNRTAELAIALPVGLISYAQLLRARRV